MSGNCASLPEGLDPAGVDLGFPFSQKNVEKIGRNAVWRKAIVDWPVEQC